MTLKKNYLENEIKRLNPHLEKLNNIYNRIDNEIKKDDNLTINNFDEIALKIKSIKERRMLWATGSCKTIVRHHADFMRSDERSLNLWNGFTYAGSIQSISSSVMIIYMPRINVSFKVKHLIVGIKNQYENRYTWISCSDEQWSYIQEVYYMDITRERFVVRHSSSTNKYNNYDIRENDKIIAISGYFKSGSLENSEIVWYAFG